MNIDIQGRIANTKLSGPNCLLPLFEAVANSIHAVHDGKARTPKIEVRIVRDVGQGVLKPEMRVNQPVESFEISDNGVGFTEEQFRSFNTADSRLKSGRGGKGIGRFMWLKAFSRAEIDSTYRQGLKALRRRFTFTLKAEDGIEGMTVEDAGEKATCRTVVRLVGLSGKYKECCPKSAETIARRIIEHCLEDFVHGTAPRLILSDDADGSDIVLNDIYDAEMKRHAKSETFRFEGQKFKVTHMLVPAAVDDAHRLHFCAHKRSVLAEPLPEWLPDLKTKTSPIRDPDADRPLYYSGYVSGDFLDSTVTPDRTSFEPHDDGMMFEGIKWPNLVERTVKQARGFLDPHLASVRDEKKRQIEQYVQADAPQYRPLLKHRPALIEAIPPNLPPDKLELRLYEADQTYSRELKAEYQDLLAEGDAEALDVQGYRTRFEQFIEQWNEAGMARLARYVAYRKATLAFLGEQLKLDEQGKYPLEEAIHRIIFPLRSTSDDVPFDQRNLWVIDERLAYHSYLASDVPFKKNKAAPLDTLDRPDIIVFNRPIAVVESDPPYSSVVIFEFKRAGRDDYKPGDNPIDQVYGYVRKLRTPGAKDKNGRPLNVREGTPFYAYIVCDITPTLREMAENAGFKPTPDDEGFFAFNLGTYIEVVSFRKMLRDANKRNAVLFEMLGVSAGKQIVPLSA